MPPTLADGAPLPQSSFDEDDAKQTLWRYLRSLRAAMLWKLDGLSERDARWPVTPTGTNLVGVVKHVASMEYEYFGLVFDRPAPEPLPWLADDAETNADLFATADQDVAWVREFYARAAAHADATIDSLPLGAPGRVPWWGDRGEVTLHTILVHMTTELARHAGHVDIVRETLDGQVGMGQRGSNLPDQDPQQWADYVARLKTLAEEAG